MEQLRRYELLEVIGKGTTGSVHKVARKADGTLLVLKQVAPPSFELDLSALEEGDPDARAARAHLADAGRWTGW